MFYLTLVLAHSTVEGHWKDTGGSAASLLYLNGYECTVSVPDATGHSAERVTQVLRAGDLVSQLIHTEQVRRDPWEYIFLAFILAPVLGIIKAGLFCECMWAYCDGCVALRASCYWHTDGEL